MSKSESINFAVIPVVILEDTTNDKFKYLTGRKGRLFLREGFSATFDMGGKYLYTSNVKKIDTKDEKIILTTLNSVYTFKKEKDNG